MIMAMIDSTALLDINAFDGPLDLLNVLIDKNKVNIYDIPIVEITDQYIRVLETMESLDMDLASEFLVMAATLLQLKSYSLLPHRKVETESAEDPRDELVIKLLRYRHCRLLAIGLKDLHQTFQDTVLRLPEPSARLGISREYVEDSLDIKKFRAAVKSLNDRNRGKYHDLRKNVNLLLQREKVSLKDKVKEILSLIWHRKTVFHEIYPPNKSSRMEQATGFLALLELMRQNRIKVSQKIPYGTMLIEQGLLLNEEDAISGVEIMDEELLADN